MTPSQKAAAAPQTASREEAGELPPWQIDELPEPERMERGSILRAIGPGIIVLGGSIGTGEWLMGPGVTARFQGQMLWLATVAIILQTFLNSEVIRYALYTGEPIFTGFLRTKPGPRFWSIVYLLCDAGMFFPAFAAAVAQLIVAALLGVGQTPGPDNRFQVMWIGIGISLLCFVLMLFGGKIYNMLQASMGAMVVWILLYLVAVDVLLVPAGTWFRIFRGFFWPFQGLPAGLKMADWGMIAAFAAYAGAGGLSNATFSNYARDKGWGMGGLVGAIPSAIGGINIGLSPLGKVFQVTPETKARWDRWWGVVRFDQYGVWALGCLMGMMLPAVLTLEFVPPMEKINGMDIASMQARGIADQFPAHRQLFWILTLFCGFLILWSTQVQALDHVTRRWTDILWTGSARAREASHQSVKRIYYTIALVYALMNAGVLIGTTLLGGTPLTIVIIQATTAGFAMVVSGLHTLYVNRRFLPKELQPSLFRQGGLVLCSLFYLVMTSLAVYGQFFAK